MLEKYRTLIYTSASEQEKVKKECLKAVVNNYPTISEDEILKAIYNNTPNSFDEDYCFELAMTEGGLLFNKVVEKFGNKLWNGRAWKNKSCKRYCPFGGICQKELIKIDNETYCYGQLYLKGISEHQIFEMSESQQITLLNSNGSIKVDLNNAKDTNNKMAIERFSGFFFNFTFFIVWFGDYGDNRKIKGENVIGLL